MKKFIIFPVLFLSSFNFAQANNEQLRKIELVQGIYKSELMLTQEDTLKLNATPELKKILNTRDAIHSQFGGEYCDWVRNIYIPGQDYNTKLNQMKFSVLNNGLVRAQGVNFGKKFHRDFKVSCDTKSCKIDDVFDPNSYKEEMKELAKKPSC